jgi:hypothetical protein
MNIIRKHVSVSVKKSLSVTELVAVNRRAAAQKRYVALFRTALRGAQVKLCAKDMVYVQTMETDAILVGNVLAKKRVENRAEPAMTRFVAVLMKERWAEAFVQIRIIKSVVLRVKRLIKTYLRQNGRVVPERFILRTLVVLSEQWGWLRDCVVTREL